MVTEVLDRQKGVDSACFLSYELIGRMLVGRPGARALDTQIKSSTDGLRWPPVIFGMVVSCYRAGKQRVHPITSFKCHTSNEIDRVHKVDMLGSSSERRGLGVEYGHQ